MKIITEDHGGNWWHNIRVWGGQELIVPDELGQSLIDRGLAKKVEEPNPVVARISKGGKKDAD